MYCRTMDSGAPPADPARYEPDHGRCARQWWRTRSGNSCRRRREDTPFEAVHQPGQGHLGWEVDQQVYVVGFVVELDELHFEVVADRPHDLFGPREVPVGEHVVPVPW